MLHAPAQQLYNRTRLAHHKQLSQRARPTQSAWTVPPPAALQPRRQRALLAPADQCPRHPWWNLVTAPRRDAPTKHTHNSLAMGTTYQMHGCARMQVRGKGGATTHQDIHAHVRGGCAQTRCARRRHRMCAHQCARAFRHSHMGTRAGLNVCARGYASCARV